jgi:hypothetical protein
MVSIFPLLTITVATDETTALPQEAVTSIAKNVLSVIIYGSTFLIESEKP